MFDPQVYLQVFRQEQRAREQEAARLALARSSGQMLARRDSFVARFARETRRRSGRFLVQIGTRLLAGEARERVSPGARVRPATIDG